MTRGTRPSSRTSTSLHTAIGPSIFFGYYTSTFRTPKCQHVYTPPLARRIFRAWGTKVAPPHFLTATNAAMLAAGLAALPSDARLMQAAQDHAANMARQDRYGDTDTNGHILDGHDVVYRVAQVGYEWS